MIERARNYGAIPISPAFKNEELLQQRNELEHRWRVVKIFALASAGVSLAALIGVFTIQQDHARFAAETAVYIGLVASTMYGIVLHDTGRDLSIIRNTIAKRNQYRHPDDQLV